jgi:hypothetical protein
MNATVEALPLLPDVLGQLEIHLARQLVLVGQLVFVVEGWSECVSKLTYWEDNHLLDNPTPELLARHKEAVQRMLRFGQFLVLANAQAEFPDRNLMPIVEATQSVLRDKLRLWHGSRVSAEESDTILRAAFNES